MITAQARETIGAHQAIRAVSLSERYAGWRDFDAGSSYSPDGGPVRVKVERAGARHVRFSVADEGLGIPAGEHGRIWVVSTVGRGSTFSFELPVAV